VNWLLHPLVNPGPDVSEALEEEMKRLGPEGARRQLEELAAGAAGQIALVEVPSSEAPRYAPPAGLSALGAPRLFHGRIERDFSVSSFSSLTEGASADLPDYFQGAVAEDSATAAPEGIHAFPAGARPGLCLHEIFERLDFVDDQAVDSVCEQSLKAYSLDPAKWKPVMAACVRRVLQVELEPGLTLNRIPMGERLIEREFHLPAHRLEAETLHRLVGAADAEPLKFAARTGWLKGFIDLVFRHGERFYIIDWKSNRLGPDAGAYTHAHVQAAMAVHHYPLQAQIYTLALHRYLRQRLRVYDYERSFGGVFYLFARGVDPARPDLGIWRHRPERSQIEAFDRWLDGAP
jgi:exodeoxyribonuclease V beta subunit